MAGFIAYEMYRGMNPESIRKAYLPGIAANFDSNRINNNFRKTISSPWVKNVVKGFAKIYFKRPGNSKGDNQRMAFTGEFIPHIIDAMDTLFGKNRCSVDMKNMELLAVRIGIWFAVNGEALVHADHVTIIIKTTVIHCGMDASKYTPHSLRYGGATLLALNGVPIHLIEYHGGWARNSSSLRLYLHIHIGDNEDVVANAMAACERNSLKEVQLRHSLNQR